jgi:type IV pilus secretin PilQ/predicted competence protein
VSDTQTVAPQAVITDVATEVLADAVRVIVSSTAPLQYTAFTLPEPPRLVVDIPGATLGKLPQPLPVAGELIREIEAQTLPEERLVRLLIHLQRTALHTVEMQAQQLHITFREPPRHTAEGLQPVAPVSPGGQTVAPAPQPVESATAVLSSARTVVTQVDFVSLADSSVVVIQTTGAQPQVRVQQRQEPLRLSLNIAQAQLNPDQERTVPVADPQEVVTQLRTLQSLENDDASVTVVAHLRVPAPFEVRQDHDIVRLVVAKPVVGPTVDGALTPALRQPAVLEQAQIATPPAQLVPAQLATPPVPAPPGGRPPPSVQAPSATPVPPALPPAAGVPAPGVAAPIGESSRYTGERISLDFQNADINDILRLIAEVSGLNIIAGGDVQGTVTTRMVDVPWDQALDVILKINGLAQEREGNIIRVAPISRFISERQETLRARQTENQAEPTITQLVPINYANAADLRSNLEKLLSARGSIFIDARTNTMIITDTRKNLDDMLALVDTLDRQTPQVMIEARIVEATRNFSRQLGIRLGGRYAAVTDRTFPNRIGISGGITDPALPGNFLVDLPAAVGVGSGGAIGVALAGASSLLNIELSALEETGLGKTISNPRIATLDNTEAQILSGVRIPFETTSAEGTKTEFIDASLILKVTPHVTPDGFINLKISITNNQPNQAVTSAAGQPSINTREASTAMLVRDGDTVIIGGLYRRVLSSNRSGVPGISQVPVLGWLFRNTAEADNNEELLVFITPRIIRQPEQPGKSRVERSY